MVTPPLPKTILMMVVACFAILIYSSSKKSYPYKTGKIRIGILNKVGDRPLLLDSMEYLNPSNELYRISKFKYYISNIILTNSKHTYAEPDSYHLIDASDNNSLTFSFDAPVNNYTGISFLIGVDSIKNVSGAQSGALDPAHGMFWTWNSGYIFFKLEGSSPASTIINHKVEYHIGGFSGSNNALQTVNLSFDVDRTLQVTEGKNNDIIIAADINKLWSNPNHFTIAEMPATMTPGVLSKKVADNYYHIFSIYSVSNK
jgi:hypothetical protein